MSDYRLVRYFGIIILLIWLFTDTTYAIEDREIIGQSAVVIDEKTGRILYSKNAFDQKAMASTTKIMTCILVLEHYNEEMSCAVSERAQKAPEVKLYLKKGQEFLVKDLLYALMLESSNDVAIVVAESIGGDVETFCRMMTDKAKEIGAVNTSFKTPNGLDAQGHYSTAYDLALITRYALQNQKFVALINTPSYEFNELNSGKAYKVNNKNAFLKMYQGASGVKTGFTNKAGLCFVGYAKRDDVGLISVVLASSWPPHKNDRYKDTVKMMDYGFESFNYIPVFKEPICVKIDNIAYGYEEAVVGECRSEDLAYLGEEEKIYKVVKMKHITKAPIVKGQEIGEISVFIDDEYFNTYPIVSRTKIDKINWQYCFQKVMKAFIGE